MYTSKKPVTVHPPLKQKSNRQTLKPAPWIRRQQSLSHGREKSPITPPSLNGFLRIFLLSIPPEKWRICIRKSFIAFSRHQIRKGGNDQSWLDRRSRHPLTSVVRGQSRRPCREGLTRKAFFYPIWFSFFYNLIRAFLRVGLFWL